LQKLQASVISQLMKRFMLALALSFSSFSAVSAQNIAYEVIRTEEAPGFFALRVYCKEIVSN